MVVLLLLSRAVDVVIVCICACVIVVGCVVVDMLVMVWVTWMNEVSSTETVSYFISLGQHCAFRGATKVTRQCFGALDCLG